MLQFFLLQVLRTSWLRQFCQQVGQLEPVLSSCVVSPEVKSTETNNTGSNHTDEDAASILKFVNTASVAELAATRHVSSYMAKHISSHRDEHGPFASVADLLQVPGIGTQRLQTICRGIMRPPLEVAVGKRDGSKADKIGIANSRIEAVKDVVAVDIGLKHMSWVHMSRDRWVGEWKLKDIVGITSGKWDPPSYLKIITETITEMPKPDLYVLQHKSYSNANKSTFPMFLFQRTMECMLYASLNYDAEDTGTLRAVSIPQLQIGRYFNLQVRGVRMSGQELVANLIGEGVDRGAEGQDPSVRIAEEDADIFHSATKHEREHLSNCLLQAIAFFDLMVGKN